MPLPQLDTPPELREIRQDDILSGFRLGDPEFEPLKRFIRRDAKRYHSSNLAKTYVVFSSNDGRPYLLGYITLICAEVKLGEENGVDDEFKYPSFPAVKIARLAVRKEFQGQGVGLGRSMVEFALGLVKESICPKVGCRFVVVDAKKKSVEFYRKCGLVLLDTEENKALSEPVMFIDLLKISSN